jgi:hypothetical protein
MKDNVLPFACGAVENARVNIVPAPVSSQPAAAVVSPRRPEKPVAKQDYFVSVGSTTYQISIATVDGTRQFRLRQAVRLACR